MDAVSNVCRNRLGTETPRSFVEAINGLIPLPSQFKVQGEGIGEHFMCLSID